MSKNVKKRKKKHGISKRVWGILGISTLILVLSIGVFVYKQNEAEKKEDAAKEELMKNGLAFPYELDDGKLVVDSVFQYTGLNMDCEDQECEDTGAIQITNKSAEHLAYADITLKLASGNEMIFRIEEIPSGKSVMAFDTENKTYDKADKVIDIKVKTSYVADASLKEDQVSLSVENTKITVGNTSSETLENITIKYHCDAGETYVGGKCREALVEALAAGENTVVEASGCYFGEAAVVNIID